MQWPLEVCPTNNNLTLKYNSKVFESPFTKVRQAASLPGAHWKLSMTINDMTDREARIVEVITDELKGQVEVIQVMDHTRLGGPAKGTPLVAIAGETGRTLKTKGWTPNTLVLQLGDLITVNGELKRLREDISSSSAGLATLTFNPPLRKPPPVDMAIITEAPYIIATLDDDGAPFKRVPGQRQSVSLSFTEAIHR